ncbi:cupin domain-containing protein [Haloarchaeobius amylolyticus]|uniref:cupin domain-containing protein n=1 Tax=Haloarchaeobius amylolyticus TaxID=1198296 RepID=UPI00226F1656|nr:cupin domain-containing protein [Haloarchaeobius amylolyticus]
MSYTKTSTADVDSVIDEEYGGMWFLRDALETEHVGVTIMELEPGSKGKEHDHSHDGQEEVYVVVAGTVDVELEDETVPLAEDEALRLSADETRQLKNPYDEVAKLVLVGAGGD